MKAGSALCLHVDKVDVIEDLARSVLANGLTVVENFLEAHLALHEKLRPDNHEFCGACVCIHAKIGRRVGKRPA